MNATMSRAVICSNCGDPTGEYSTERTSVRGRCCSALPGLFEPDGDGRFTRSADGPSDEDDESFPRCTVCGSTDFHATSTEVVTYWHRVAFDGADLIVAEDPHADSDFDCLERGAVVCDSCEEPYRGDVPIEWS